jgi:hypothetical protein
MAWFYNGKQIYGTWIDSEGANHPSTWDEDWSEEEKKAKGLIDKGEINARFFNDDGTKKTSDEIKANELARMDGLSTFILGATCSDVISEVDGSPLEEDIPESISSSRAETEASRLQAQSLILEKDNFDGLYDLIMNSNKMVHGIHVPSGSGSWGTEAISEDALHRRPPLGTE